MAASITNTIMSELDRRLERDLGTVASLWELTLKADSPRESGDLADSMSVDGPNRAGRGYTLVARAEAEYAAYVDQGTGVFAGGGPITPRSGEFLVFYSVELGRTVFAKQVQGQPPQKFWAEPMPQRLERVMREVFA